MKAHFAAFPDYLYRAASKLDLYVGVGAGILFLLVAYFTSIDQQTVATATVSIVALSFFMAGYGVYRDERELRAERDSALRMTAELVSLAANTPDPGPDRTRLTVQVLWEMWVQQDVSTDKLALNLIYVYDKPWWRFWKKTRFPQKGIPPNMRDHNQYRKLLSATKPQPIKDSARFDYIAERNMPGDPHWLLELVLITGMPKGEYRIPVYIDYDKIQSRGTHPSL